MSYAISTTVEGPYDIVVEKVRTALGDQGFGILTEIDIQATMKAKMNTDVPAQIILGACRPPLALAALQAEPSIGLLLPCNVVVRATGDQRTVVEAVDPQTMIAMTGNPALQSVADDAAQRPTAWRKALPGLPDSAARSGHQPADVPAAGLVSVECMPTSSTRTPQYRAKRASKAPGLEGPVAFQAQRRNQDRR